MIPVYSFTRVLSTNTKCTRGCGCNGHPAFPTPSLGGRFINASGALRGEGEKLYREFHVIASEAKQSILPLRREMDCFASLAMTVLHLNRRGSLKIESEAYSAFALLQRCAAAPEIQTAATDRTIRRCSPA